MRAEVVDIGAVSDAFTGNLLSMTSTSCTVAGSLNSPFLWKRGGREVVMAYSAATQGREPTRLIHIQKRGNPAEIHTHTCKHIRTHTHTTS
eukprot:m.172818 g.172818  ORF g.172818 m.172818 type:complete len:91 (+) comp13500_c1_seq89:1819-2091(+)